MTVRNSLPMIYRIKGLFRFVLFFLFAPLVRYGSYDNPAAVGGWQGWYQLPVVGVVAFLNDNGKRSFVWSVLVVLLFGALIFEPGYTALAQDATMDVTPTAEVTVEPMPDAPAQPDAPPSDNTIWTVGFIVIAVYSLISQWLKTRDTQQSLRTFEQALKEQRIIIEGQQRYLEASLPAQEFVKLLGSVAGVLGAMNIPNADQTIDTLKEYIDKVTSGEPSVSGGSFG